LNDLQSNKAPVVNPTLMGSVSLPETTEYAGEQLSDRFAAKVDYALPTNAQTGTTYTFVAADAERLTTASNAAAVTLTIPPQSSVTWGDDTVLRVVNYGAGAVTIDGGSGVTVTNTATTVAQYGAAVAIRTGSDAWTVVPFGGGDVPAAEVSSPAATGQYTDTGVTYDYYTFTSSGTLTVDEAGFADVLVVGGGGAGGAVTAGGGGAGGHLYVTNAYLPAGSLTVTVGAGGASVSRGAENAARSGNNGNPSRLNDYISPGGGGGAGSPRNTGGTPYQHNGFNGGSGGGGSSKGSGSNSSGGAGLSGLGSNGGGSSSGGAGGGGGANAAGGTTSTNAGGNGGDGLANSITGSAVTRAGGGGGVGVAGTAQGTGGTGGGGAAAETSNAVSGTANTGGGGGGTSTATSGSGGSGVVIVRVKV